MRQIILQFPEQFKVGVEAVKEIKIRGKFKRIFICGMGGSSLPGEILKMYLEYAKINIPLTLHRNYSLPPWAEENDLAFAISYSGNTEETISAFEEALKRKLKLISITSGGRLAQISQENKVPLILIPGHLPPRMALGYLVGSLFKALINLKILPEITKEILKLETTLEPRKWEKEGKILAKKLKNKIPLIYSSAFNFPLAKIWKIKFNENSKVPAFANFFPELNHNEMVGFSENQNLQFKIQNFHLLILKDTTDHPRILKRMDLTAKILRKRGLKVENIYLPKKEFFQKIFSNLLLADWASYYLALNYQIDPMPVKIVQEFKKLMEK